MPKQSTIYECAKCGAQALKWSGRCLECGGWGTLQETVGVDSKPRKVIDVKPGQVVKFNEINQQEVKRLKTGIGEFDRVMGGGIVPGSLTLLGGEPGIGKSTLILQICERVGKTENATPTTPPTPPIRGDDASRPPLIGGVGGVVGVASCLYISGEESAQQIKLRIDRLNLQSQNINFLGDTSVETIIATIKETKPGFVVIDSIQTIISTEIPSEAGSVSQIRACTVKLLELAKESNIPIFIIGHITKDGSVAGPKTLEHLVDTVLYLEGDAFHQFRILRTIKNRFGATNEVGIFEMRTGGLIEIKNPSAVFLEDREENIAGSVIAVLMEGTRAFLVEVQALVNSTSFGLPQRRASGFDLNRLQLLIAVLSKRCGLKLHNQDVTINIAGGFRVQEPAVDLAVCLAIASALQNKPLGHKTVVIGEVGLSGEVRAVNQLPTRLKEAEKLGFESIIMGGKKSLDSAIKVLRVKDLGEALNLF